MSRQAPPGEARKQASVRPRLESGLREVLGDDALADPLMAYLQELLRWNRAYNLTAVRDPAEMVTRHVLDSLAALPGERDLPQGARVCDVGAGAGLPGIPWALARPDIHVTLIDSVGKKVRFMRHAIRTLSLDNAEAHQVRAEAFDGTEPFDVVVCRAFASLHDFIEMTAHLAGGDGRWLAMKGKLVDSELAQLPEGFKVSRADALHVPGLREDRHLVVIERAAPVARAESA
ncbi:16S rRNA (guanine(527)-N(7))-methyltransferase RsmG [Algiphilus sp.]|uniref:16S rRNA (guanine(527)-N(7))-methyltransferase RsmG n=1 Tax=Algiphilus sp. TaxID=1872431 RepID=UPI003B516D3E